MKVYISPSLQENNIGAGDYGTEERQMQLVGDAVVQLLQYNHLEVYKNNPSMTLQEAVADSNAKKVDLHYAIHSDAFNGKARGCTILYKSNGGAKAAACTYKYLEPLTPASDRGLRQTDNLYELNNTDAVAALAEVSFHDNIEDAAFIMNNIQAIGEAIAQGICDYFGIAFNKPQPVEVGKLYKVQVGAFRVKSNANNLLNELKEKGYNPFIVEV